MRSVAHTRLKHWEQWQNWKGKGSTEQALVSSPERNKRYTWSKQSLHSVRFSKVYHLSWRSLQCISEKWEGRRLTVRLPATSLMPKVTVICYTRSQPWGYGHHPRGSRMQQRIRVNITRPLISTHIVESHEFTRPRAEPSLPKHHDDHIAGKGYTSPAKNTRCKSCSV